MNNWEDIIKNRLEGYESPLPEGSLAGFHAKREAKRSPASRKAVPWIWGMSTAIAAGIAAVLLLNRTGVQEDIIRVVEQVPAPIAMVDEITQIDNQQVDEPRLDKPQFDKPRDEAPKFTPFDNPAPVPQTDIAFTEEEPIVPKEDSTALENPDNQIIIAPEQIPSIISDTDRRPVKTKVAPAAASVAGGGLLTAGLTSLIKKNNTVPQTTEPGAEPNPGANIPNIDLKPGSYSHSFPFKAGLSVRIPLSDRLSITSGLEYSLYKSTLKSDTESYKQTVHYLGIPVRLDWRLAQNRWLDVYLGAGVQGDFCIAASLDNNKIAKDGINFSLLGAGGIQFNFTKRIGLYLEPQLSWLIPSDGSVLETYRTNRPLNFSLVTGLRISLGNR